MHLQRRIAHVAQHAGLRLQFQQVGRVHRPLRRAIQHQVADADLALDHALLADHQHACLARCRGDVAAHTPVQPQAPGKHQVAVDGGVCADQRIDRKALLLGKQHRSLLSRSYQARRPGAHRHGRRLAEGDRA
ncbi:hypothetical protein D9M72_554620 [compost metagenome]